MKLVIDISEDVYNKIQSMDWKNIVWAGEEHTAIHNGKLVKETIIFDDDGIGHKVYEGA